MEFLECVKLNYMTSVSNHSVIVIEMRMIKSHIPRYTPTNPSKSKSSFIVLAHDIVSTVYRNDTNLKVQNNDIIIVENLNFDKKSKCRYH